MFLKIQILPVNYFKLIWPCKKKGIISKIQYLVYTVCWLRWQNAPKRKWEHRHSYQTLPLSCVQHHDRMMLLFLVINGCASFLVDCTHANPNNHLLMSFRTRKMSKEGRVLPYLAIFSGLLSIFSRNLSHYGGGDVKLLTPMELMDSHTLHNLPWC